MGDHHLAHIRTEFGRFTRQVSGYSLEHLLPERRRLDRFLVGSEGTLAVVLEATVRLVADETGRLLVVLGYPSMAEAADAVPELLSVGWRPADRLRGAGRPDRRPREGQGAAVPELPAGRRLAVRRGGRRGRAGPWPTRSSPRRPRSATARSPTSPSRPRCGGSARTARAWPRAASAPRRTPAGRTPPSRPSASVPGCATSTSCCASTTWTACPTATSATAACTSASTSRSRPGDARGPKVFRDFLTASALKLREHRGSLSGEHGDGRARSELLPLMYDEESLMLFAAAKAVCDPAQPAQPRQPRRPGAARRRPPAGAAAGRRPERAPAGPRRRLPGRRRAPLHRRRQVRRARPPTA